MARTVSQSDLDRIADVVAQFPDGAAIGDVTEALEASVPRRTLQRHLSLLVDQNRLITDGRGRAIRYRLTETTGKLAVAQPLSSESADAEPYIPISAAGDTIKQLVRKSIHKRNPVGYNRDFLDQYRPNESFYLSQADQKHLLEVGKSSEEKQVAGTYARQIFDRLLIDLSWNSSRLEGNTYSLLETNRLLELGEVAEGKDARDAQMILNHKAAIELVVEQAEEVDFNRYTILNLHALLSDNLLADPQACGRLRSIAVGIGGTVYYPLEVPQLIDECFQQILDTVACIQNPFEQAFFTMVHIPYLQPFEDVNKRVSRLAMNLPLIRNNLCPLSFVDVPERAYVDGILGVYELNRVELLRDVFVWAYERSAARYSALRRSLGEPDKFRLQYRTLIANSVFEIVDKGMDKTQATAFIQNHATEDVPHADRAQLIEVVETEVLNLHEGNIARFRVRPSQYQTWKATWI